MAKQSAYWIGMLQDPLAQDREFGWLPTETNIRDDRSYR